MGSNTSASKPRVLFVCTGNSARSIMAEALLRHHAGERFEPCSAGMEPKGVNPLTLRVLQEIGVDTAGLSSKNTMEFLGRTRVDYAIIVCESANKSCPRIQPFALRTHFWPFDDPASAIGTEEQRIAEFRRIGGAVVTGRCQLFANADIDLVANEGTSKYLWHFSVGIRHGHPAAHLVRKQLKSATLSIGSIVEPSQLA